MALAFLPVCYGQEIAYVVKKLPMGRYLELWLNFSHFYSCPKSENREFFFHISPSILVACRRRVTLNIGYFLLTDMKLYSVDFNYVILGKKDDFLN